MRAGRTTTLRVLTWGLWAGVWTTSACGLFLGDPKDPLCAFAGRSSRCGACLVDECLEDLGPCCGAGACHDVLDTLDRCAASGACADRFERAGAAKLARCLERTCASACDVGAVDADAGADSSSPDVSTTAPSEPEPQRPKDAGASEKDAGATEKDAGATEKDAGGATEKDAGGESAPDGGVVAGPTCWKLGAQGCTCDPPGAPHPPARALGACTEAVGLGAICCAESGWPSTGTCSCMTADCDRPAGGGCSCQLGVQGDSCNDGVVCCVSPWQECLCTYGVQTCWDGYRKVDHCEGATIGCGSKKRVLSCSQ